jgi:hypothetical protein
MKKIGFVCVMALLVMTSVDAQSRNQWGRYDSRNVVNATISAGLPLSDASDVSDVNLSAGLLFQTVVNQNLNLTFGATYSHFIGKKVTEELITIEYDDISSILLGAGARGFFTQDFSVGIELGYGIGITPENYDGGFYYSPNLRYYVSSSTNIFLNYTSIASDGSVLASINLGLEFGL